MSSKKSGGGGGKKGGGGDGIRKSTGNAPNQRGETFNPQKTGHTPTPKPSGGGSKK